jgi:hypothetical protein
VVLMCALCLVQWEADVLHAHRMLPESGVCVVIHLYATHACTPPRRAESENADLSYLDIVRHGAVATYGAQFFHNIETINVKEFPTRVVLGLRFDGCIRAFVVARALTFSHVE